jgi:RNA polymerase sigma-70 factor (ECF subfamily)
MPATFQQHEETSIRAAMDRYATGDDSAFEVLYDKLAPRLRAMLRRRGCDFALTEDLLQQTFLQLHVARAHYRRGQEVLPWAFAIARRLLIDVWRRNVREQRRVERNQENPPGPEDVVIADETARQLERGFDQLPLLHREAFSLVKMDGLSLHQTAQVLGTSVTAIKLRVHRAYQQLRGAAQESSE